MSVMKEALQVIGFIVICGAVVFVVSMSNDALIEKGVKKGVQDCAATEADLRSQLTTKEEELVIATIRAEVAIAATRFFAEESPRAKQYLHEKTTLVVCRNGTSGDDPTDPLFTGEVVAVGDASYWFNQQQCYGDHASLILVPIINSGYGDGWQLSPDMNIPRYAYTVPQFPRPSRW